MRTENESKQIGAILKAQRESIGLSQADVARVIGIKNFNFISMIEAGKSNPPIARLIDICRAYELPPEWSAVIIRYLHQDVWKAFLHMLPCSLFGGAVKPAEVEKGTELLVKKYADRFKIAMP